MAPSKFSITEPLRVSNNFYFAVQLPSDGCPIVISGPSGVGKGTLYKMLLERHPDTFATSVSHTTRDPRPGEVRDEDYFYISMKEFEDLIEKGGFVEHAKFGGNRYGTSRKMIEDMRRKGKVVILDIEMEVCYFPFLFSSCPRFLEIPSESI